MTGVERAVAQTRDAHQAFEALRRDTAAHVAELATRTARRARNDGDVDAVDALGDKLAASYRTLIAASGRVGQKSALVIIAARDLPGGRDDVEALLSDAEGLRARSTAALHEAGAAAREALDKVAEYKRRERADKDLCLQAAEAAVTTERLSDALRDLQCAERVYRHRTDYNPRLHYVWGSYYDERAQRARSRRARVKHLRRARQRYDRFIESGHGYLIDRVRQRRDEIDRQLAGE